jgi:hypothetical protein
LELLGGKIGDRYTVVNPNGIKGVSHCQLGARWCRRRAARDTSGICGGRLSCRRQRGDASTEAFASARPGI